MKRLGSGRWGLKFYRVRDLLASYATNPFDLCKRNGHTKFWDTSLSLIIRNSCSQKSLRIYFYKPFLHLKWGFCGIICGTFLFLLSICLEILLNYSKSWPPDDVLSFLAKPRHIDDFQYHRHKLHMSYKRWRMTPWITNFLPSPSLRRCPFVSRLFLTIKEKTRGVNMRERVQGSKLNPQRSQMASPLTLKSL